MKEKIKKISQSPFVINSTKLFSANVIAQGIGLIVYPILTRLYTPENFGLLNLFLSIGNICLLISTGEYRYAVLLPKTENETIGVVKLCFRLVLCTSIFAVGIIPFVPILSNVANLQDLQLIYWMVPIYICTLGIWETLSKWHLRRKEFSFLGEFQIVHGSTAAISKIILGALGSTKIGLVVSTIFAPIIAIINHTIRHRKSIKPLCHQTDYKISVLLKKYRNFPLLTLPRSLTNTVADSLPALLLAPTFGLAALGFYSMALITLRPIQMIVNTLFQTLYEYVADKKRKCETIKPICIKTCTHLLLYSIIPFLILIIFAPNIIIFFFGKEWMQTGVYVRYLCPWFYFIFLSGPFCFIPELFNKQKTFLAIEVIYFILQIGAMVLGICFHNIDIAIISLSVVGSVIICIQLFYNYKTITEYESTIKTLQDTQ